jgi:phytoene desaturase
VAAAVSRRAIVIGAGLGGLSAACHLAGAGWDVEVIERGSTPGGRAGRIERDGFQFDTGPTVLTMPDLLAATFAAAGAEMDDFVTLHRLDPAYRAWFADGSGLQVRADREAMADEVRSVCGPGEAAAFDRYCDWLGRLYSIEMRHFLDRNYDRVSDLVRPLGPALALLRTGALRHLDTVVGRAFCDERLQRLFSFQSLYAGVAPQQALAVLAVIGYMDVVAGVHFPEGGVHSMASGLAAAAEKAGVRFRYELPVERILLAGGDGGAVVGVATADGTQPADAVVCNGDLPAAYGLVPGLPLPRRLRRPRYSPSALVWHAGVRGRPGPAAAHHNLHFGSAWAGSFGALIDDGVRMPDPSLLVSVPTVTEPAMAPDGASVLYALEPVPNLTGRVDWALERPRAEDGLRRALDRLGYPVADVVVSELVDPVDWARAGMAAGTPFSLAHQFRQSGPFRPANVDARAPCLVFAGCGTVPGVGIPMVLLSGKLAAARLGGRGAPS